MSLASYLRSGTRAEIGAVIKCRRNGNWRYFVHPLTGVTFGAWSAVTFKALVQNVCGLSGRK